MVCILLKERPAFLRRKRERRFYLYLSIKLIGTRSNCNVYGVEHQYWHVATCLVFRRLGFYRFLSSEA